MRFEEDGITKVESADHLQELVRAHGGRGAPFAPWGSGASWGRGTPPSRPPHRVDLSGLSALVDHPAADLTITIEAGMRIDAVERQLAAHGQWVPSLSFNGSSGTVGGSMAADRRSLLAGGLGSLRDAVLAVTMIDGNGDRVSAGARVVKSVAGYDVMKLMIGSLGVLGAIVEVTLKTAPLPETWGAVRFQGELSQALFSDAVRRTPIGFYAAHCEEKPEHLVVFSGSAIRVKAQVGECAAVWGDGAEVLDEDETRGRLAVLAESLRADTKNLVWGGALPSDLITGIRVLGDAFWVADLLRGHVWIEPRGDVEAPTLLQWRNAWPREGHLHLDVPRGATCRADAWGSAPGEEAVYWRRIKTALDPHGVWVAGRLPGGV